MRLASDLDNTDFVNPVASPDDFLSVKFERRKFRNEFKSEQEGAPVYEERDFITIQSPGDKLTIIDTLATPEYKSRFSRQWAAFLKDTDQPTPGTLITDWAALSEGQLYELQHYRFRTVEQFANTSFSIIQSMGMGYQELQQKAVEFLNLGKHNTQADELAKRDSQIEDLKSQLDEIVKMLKPKKLRTSDSVDEIA